MFNRKVLVLVVAVLVTGASLVCFLPSRPSGDSARTIAQAADRTLNSAAPIAALPTSDAAATAPNTSALAPAAVSVPVPATPEPSPTTVAAPAATVAPVSPSPAAPATHPVLTARPTAVAAATAAHERRATTFTAEDLKDVIAVQERYTDGLLEIDGIIGTAAGAGRVIVLADSPSAADAIPPELDGIPVAVHVTGTIRSIAGTASSATDRFPRPVPIGVSTGNERELSAGTIAARVLQGSTVYALSNNHVFALENRAPKGSRILQPGLYDTDRGIVNPDNVIGTLADFEPITFRLNSRNQIDAAIALSSTALLGKATPSDGYGTPLSAVVAAAVGQDVQKYGRSTALTHGAVTGINATVRISYSSGTATFTNQIIVESGSAFILAGDSGSLLVTDPSRNPVGLLFAGNDSGTYAIANPISAVLSRFNVTIDGESVTNLAVNSISAASSVVKGNSATVTVTVANVGSQAVSGSIPVTLTDETDGVAIGSQNIAGLAVGASRTLAFTWNTAAASVGAHTLKAVQGFSDANAADDSAVATIAVTAPVTTVTVKSISPATMKAGRTISVTLTGTGFASGATVLFLNGAGTAPLASGVVVVNAATITAQVTARAATNGQRPTVWDVRVSLPNGPYGVLARGFTVTP